MARRSKRGKTSGQQSPTHSAAEPSPFARNWDFLWLAAATIVAFASSVPGNFVWLDHAEIEQANYRVVDSVDFRRVWHETIEQYQGRRSGVAVEQGGYFRPVYALAISLDWALWNGRPWCYHVENILWHLAVVLLLYTFGNQVFGQTPDSRRAVFWATLLFAVHPFGVHSVAWISGRKDTMCAAFGVAALVAFGRAIDLAKRDESARVFPWLVLSGISLVLAIGCKELGFVVPIVAAVFFFPPFQVNQGATPTRLWRVWFTGLSVLAACAAFLTIYRVAVVEARGLGAAYPTDSLLRNVATSTNLWWHYVLRILLPYQVNLSDAWPAVQSMGPTDVLSVLTALALAAATAYGLLRRKPWALAMVWFVIWMLPVSGLMPLRHFRAERYLYPASWGILLAALLLLLPVATALFASHAKRVTTILLGLLAAWYTLTTIRENTYWWNDATLFSRSVAQDPRHVEGRIELCRLALQQQNYPEAIRLAGQALKDFYDRTYVAYGVPFYAYQCLGVAHMHLGEPAEAIKVYQQALRELPNSPSAYSGLAMAEAMAGDFPSARRHFVQSLELDPTDVDARNNLSLVLIQLGQFAEAEPHIERLIAAQPGEVSHRARLAWSQWKQGKREAALANLNLARAQSPNDPSVQKAESLIREEQNVGGARP